MAMYKPRRDSVEGSTPANSAPAQKPSASTGRGGSTQMFDRKGDGDKARNMGFNERVDYQKKKSGGLYGNSSNPKRDAMGADKKGTSKAAKRAAIASMFKKMGK